MYPAPWLQHYNKVQIDYGGTDFLLIVHIDDNKDS